MPYPLALLLAPVAALSAAPEGCATAHVERCANTGSLVWAPGFDAVVAAFLGPAARTIVRHSFTAPLAVEVENLLGGPPDHRTPLADGGSLFTACRAHSCTEKGAIAFDRAGRVTLIATLTFHCGRAGGCADAPWLDLYVRREPGSEAARAAVAAWARTTALADGHAMHEPAIVHELPAARAVSRPAPPRSTR